VIDHTAAYFARALWNPQLDTAAFYQWYAERLIGEASGVELASQLTQIDRGQHWPGHLTDEHVGSTGWDGGHSNEAGAAFNPLATPETVMQHFQKFSDALAKILEGLSGAELERGQYHAAQVAFVRHYVVSQQEAAAIDELVGAAGSSDRYLTRQELDAANRHLEILFDAVRSAVEVFAGVLATTADLGVLASLNQKYVQRAIWQRVDALREVIADPTAVSLPDLSAGDMPARIFVPVPPEVVGRNGVEVEAIVHGTEAVSVTVYFTPLDDAKQVTDLPLQHKGRGVWSGLLQSAIPVRYWVVARIGDGEQVRSPAADNQVFSAIALMNE
jgi:hypothetical protein